MISFIASLFEGGLTRRGLRFFISACLDSTSDKFSGQSFTLFTVHSFFLGYAMNLEGSLNKDQI